MSSKHSHSLQLKTLLKNWGYKEIDIHNNNIWDEINSRNMFKKEFHQTLTFP